MRAAEPDFGHPISTHFSLETDDLKVNGSVLLSPIVGAFQEVAAEPDIGPSSAGGQADPNACWADWNT